MYGGETAPAHAHEEEARVRRSSARRPGPGGYSGLRVQASPGEDAPSTPLGLYVGGCWRVLRPQSAVARRAVVRLSSLHTEGPPGHRSARRTGEAPVALKHKCRRLHVSSRGQGLVSRPGGG
eukprot:scaffold2502_cov362-Prasinococcus_capsulatus_cf.AAC.4